MYDVTAGAHAYGVGGSYHNFAGVDAARAFATSCTKGHRTHDLRGLSEKELKSLEKWKQYFADKPKYPRIGKVMHLPLDRKKPIPGRCGAELPDYKASPTPFQPGEQQPAKKQDL